MEASLRMDVTYTAPSELGSCRWLQLFQGKYSRQEMKPPGSDCALSTAVRITWAKSRSGTTCSHLAQAVFNYTWYRHYNSEWSHTRKEEKSRVGAALQGQGRRVLGWNTFVLIYSYISTGMCNFLYTSALKNSSEMIQKDLSSSFFPFRKDTWT